MGTSTKSIQQEITDRVVRALESGQVAWKQPFMGLLPSSGVTGRAYRGVNALILACVGSDYNSNLWVTYKGAQSLGGNVKRGERGTGLVKWGFSERSKTDSTGQTKIDRIPFMRAFSVFNIDQTENCEVNPDYMVRTEPVPVPVAVESMLNSYTDKPVIRYNMEGRAYWTPSTDVITLPDLTLFTSGHEFACTLAHELAHSTGHKSRLDRGFTPDQTFGCDSYGREELVAEITASMLMNKYGITDTQDNSAQYLASWITAIKGDAGLLTRACSLANRAYERITGELLSEPTSE
jgi:antirestriction protein ArdC